MISWKKVGLWALKTPLAAESSDFSHKTKKITSAIRTVLGQFQALKTSPESEI